MSDLTQGARTRAGLVEAAIELFDRHGYDNTSLDAVCRRVSVTKGALYRHFPSKQALAAAVVEEHFRRWYEVRAEIEGTGVSPLTTLVDVTHRMGCLTRTDRTVRVGVRLLFTSELYEMLAGTHFASVAVMVRDLLTRAAAAGEIPPGLDTREEADGITSAIVGAQALSLVTGSEGYPLRSLWRHKVHDFQLTLKS
ncbi:hypothetical protein GCM10022243_55580 [Saccharothrix violaceirubra]|uniref:AcrR family transcriptional regulator n=1 Tax=Saccharothrix violaceirubra TaxID=413306 RepID=A0A7W7WXW0_9PSEU|nr:TetR/AcrR family transcriptional regulator [Saccharothrix violaceirubra]MBB4967068.1 AcrR family transcriptional regulator [Saccharothrix violaceirubra]